MRLCRKTKYFPPFSHLNLPNFPTNHLVVKWRNLFVWENVDFSRHYVPFEMEGKRYFGRK